MKIKEYINNMASEYALTDEQLKEYLILNDIDVFDDTNFKNEKIKTLLEKLKNKEISNHNNKSSLNSIEIEGLFGKFNYSLKFENDISVFVSENGIGKTTILNIIIAILNADTKTLSEINFEKIKIKILDETYVLNKSKNKNKNDKINILLDKLMLYLPLNLRIKIKEFQSSKLDKDILKYIEHEIARYEIHRHELILNKEVRRIFDQLKELQYNNFSKELYRIKEKLSEEVLFYPTYRRVEVGFNKIFLEDKRIFREYEMTPKYMEFGMQDVKKRVNNLLNKVRDDANRAYINMNANIISELLQKSINIGDFGKINIHKVGVIIKRIGEDRIKNIEKLKKFLKGKDSDYKNENIEFLIYYLQKLVKIYDSQEAIDKKLSNFALVCSKYLSGKKVDL